MRTRTIILWIAILIIADQAIKIVINSYFLDCKFDIVPSFLVDTPDKISSLRRSKLTTFCRPKWSVSAGAN